MPSIASKLKRELLRNPKKTGILGVMCLVAIYFWAPLVAEWTGVGGASPPVEQVATTPQANALPRAPQAVQPVRSQKQKKFRYDTLIAAVASDPLMASAQLDPALRDPFSQLVPPPTIEVVVAESMPEDEVAETIETATEELTPQSLGMILTSTLVGNGRAVATINGRSFRESSEIEVGASANDSDVPITFTLTKVTPTRVTLVRAGHEYELELQQTKLAGRDRIRLYKEP